MLFESSRDGPAAAPRAWWPRYLLASLAALAAAWLLCRLVGPGLARVLARVWLLITGLAGLALLFFWFGTDHAVASMNLNLLVFNPLWLWPALRRGAGLAHAAAGGGLLSAGPGTAVAAASAIHARCAGRLPAAEPCSRGNADWRATRSGTVATLIRIQPATAASSSAWCSCSKGSISKSRSPARKSSNL